MPRDRVRHRGVRGVGRHRGRARKHTVRHRNGWISSRARSRDNRIERGIDRPASACSEDFARSRHAASINERGSLRVRGRRGEPGTEILAACQKSTGDTTPGPSGFSIGNATRSIEMLTLRTSGGTAYSWISTSSILYTADPQTKSGCSTPNCGLHSTRITCRKAIMSAHELIDRLEGAINSHDASQVAACFSEDYRCEMPLHPSRSFTGSNHVLPKLDRVVREVLRSGCSGPAFSREWRGDLVGVGDPRHRSQRRSDPDAWHRRVHHQPPADRVDTVLP